MTKHYCDKCGKEISIYEIVTVTIEPREDAVCVGRYFHHYELCPDCAKELKGAIEKE